MDLPSLYTPDLSLFCGDLLPVEAIPAGSSVVTDELYKSLVLDQDGLKHSVDESWSTMETPLADISLSAQDSGLGEELFGDSWLDTKIDLLDLVEDPEDIQSGYVSLSEPEFITKKSESSSAALEVLQSMAEATCQMLADEQSSITEKDHPSLAEITDVKSMGLMDLLTTDFMNTTTVEPELDWDLLNEPILSPVTAEDVESVLSSGPASPASIEVPNPTTAVSLLTQLEEAQVIQEEVIEECIVSSDSLIEIVSQSPINEIVPQSPISQSTSGDEDWEPSFSSKARKSRQRQRETPYEKPPAKILDRKLRKKQQNKDAATRYRQKKKAEQDAISDEYDGLAKRNSELREKVDQMTREIQYLKDLMADVYRAKGILPKAK